MLRKSRQFVVESAGRWLTRGRKARAALRGGLRSLQVQVTRDTEIGIPMAAHQRYWAGSFHDADLVDFLARTIPSDGLFLDVGANIGVYCAALFKLRGDIRGVAFEPIPTTVAALASTFRLNGVPFAIEGVAVSECAGTLTLSAYENGLNNFWIKHDDGKHPSVSVATVALDDWCGDRFDRVPSAIKIDVEGHELAALRGARRMLRAHRPALVLECHAASWGALGVSPVELDAEIRAIGYRRLCDRDGRDVDLTTATTTFHLLGVP